MFLADYFGIQVDWNWSRIIPLFCYLLLTSKYCFFISGKIKTRSWLFVVGLGFVNLQLQIENKWIVG